MILTELLEELKDISAHYTVSVSVVASAEETDKFVHLKRNKDGDGFKPNQRANKLYNREVEFVMVNPITYCVFVEGKKENEQRRNSI